MYTGLEIFKMASAMAKHASAGQQHVARNIANADTPGYRAVGLEPFAEAYKGSVGESTLKARRDGHFSNPLAGTSAQTGFADRTGDLSPNGNSVSIETEMMKASEIRQDHSMAVSVYRASLDLLRAGLGR